MTTSTHAISEEKQLGMHYRKTLGAQPRDIICNYRILKPWMLVKRTIQTAMCGFIQGFSPYASDMSGTKVPPSRFITVLLILTCNYWTCRELSTQIMISISHEWAIGTVMRRFANDQLSGICQAVTDAASHDCLQCRIIGR